MSNLIDSWLEELYEDRYVYEDTMDDPGHPLALACDGCGAEPYIECRWWCLSWEGEE